MWRIGAGLVAGSCAVLCLPQLPAPSVVAIIVASCALLGTVTRQHWLTAIALGVLLTNLRLQQGLADRLAPALENQAIEVTGTVTSVPQGALELLKFRFAPDDPGLPPLIELTWYDAPARVLAGERLELQVKLRRPRGFANPGGQDNEARMLREGIGASGYVRMGRRLGLPADAWVRRPVLLARAAVAAKIRDALGDRPSAGIVAGLAVGLQDAVSREQWLTLSRSGTSHLMAISGLHIAMVAALAAWAGGRLQRWRQKRGATGAQRDVAVVTGAVAALIYSLLAGWSVPTQRTMVMIALGAIALLSRRRVGVADGLALCAGAVVLIDPLAPLAPGFWLSFGAVAAILFGATGHVQKPRLLHGYLQVQAVVTLGLVPVLIGSFGAVSLVSALVNLYAIPLYTLLIVPAVLVSSATALAWPAAGSVLLAWTGALVELTWPLIENPASWPIATWSIAALEPLAWVALLVGTVAVLAPLPRIGRIAGVVIVLVACMWRPLPPPVGAARVTVLDVGQGLSAVVETHSHALVFDAGPSFRTGTDTGQLVVVPYLRQRGIRVLDVLVVSHDDDDHKGGAGSVLELIPTRRLVVGPSLVPRKSEQSPHPNPLPLKRERGQEQGPHPGPLPLKRERGQEQSPHPNPLPLLRERGQEVCRRGGRWQWDGVEFEWLHPGTRHYERDNDSSCVLRVRAGGHTLLLTGDIEAEAEAELVAARMAGPVDVVVVPHHGSRTSSTVGFVETTRPRWVVYPVGYHNRWGFPVRRVVERWQLAEAIDLRTSTGGAITFDLVPGTPLAGPAQWRVDHPRIWRDP
ncbi:MAG TPA: DNA internalization-related competence protein ComEC/Rec2 [Steroidobacteraceae bacterium]